MVNRIEKTRRELLKKGRKIINLSSGNPGEFWITFPTQILERASKKFLTNLQYEPDPKGLLEARRAVAAYDNAGQAKSLHVQTSNQILLTSGTSESYFHLFKLLAKPGEKVLFPNPSYPLCEEIARLAEVQISFYRLDEKAGWQIDTVDLESKINPQTRAIVLISPSNPTGAVLHESTLKKVLTIAGKHHLPVISDEVFSQFIFDGKKIPKIVAMSKKVDIFSLNGISKTYALPGLKLGWIKVAGPHSSHHIEGLERSIDALLATNQISQIMLPEIIKHGQKFTADFRKKLEANRNLALQILRKNPQISFHKPEGGFYLFAKISGLKMTDEDFVVELMERTGIFVHPGYFYDYDKGIYILINLLPPPKFFKESLQKILQFTKNLEKI